MPALAKNHIVIAPNLRGLGDSSKPLTGYNGKNIVEDIHQLVSQLGFREILLVGHDFGVQVAYSYTAALPNEVLADHYSKHATIFMLLNFQICKHFLSS